MDLDLRHRRIVFAGTDVVLVVRPLNRANYQRCVAEFGKPEADLAARMALAAVVLKEQVVRVEGLTVTPEDGDPHAATVDELLDYGPLAGRLTRVLIELMGESTLPEVEVKKSPPPPAAG